MRAKREEGKVSRSRALKESPRGVGNTGVRAGAGHGARRRNAAWLDGGAGATAAERRSARADRTRGVTVGPVVG